MTNVTNAFNQNLKLKKELYKDNAKALKQLDWLAVAFDLASEAEYDKALDIVTGVKVSSKIALDFLSQYTQKWELKVNYDKVQANALGIYEVNIDSLAKDNWWRVVEVEDKTITIAKTGEELLSSLVNTVANF